MKDWDNDLFPDEDQSTQRDELEEPDSVSLWSGRCDP